jgi:uncharacterized protein (DUF362 family)/Pyruvate/2-oxoacid:ferredoxin oxidoreductase delta subunit
MGEMNPVSIIQCADYTDSLESAIRELLEPLGGMAAFVKPGQAVFLKPNMLTDRTPDEAVTTHPEVIRAVIRLVRECGGNPTVGDSPAAAIKLSSVHAKTGIRALCEAENVPLISFEQAETVEVKTDAATFYIAKPILDADVVINLPKIKTHVLTTLTGAVKNLYGTLPGYQKTHLHNRFPAIFDFGRQVAALYDSIQPALSIADAVWGMEGNGPSGGDPVNLGFLAAATDGFALDVALCHLLDIKRSAVPTLQGYLSTPGHGEIEWVGPGAGNSRPQSVRLPRTLARFMPRWMSPVLSRFVWVRPDIDPDICIRCGRCVKACPANALAMPASTPAPDQPPVLSPKECIGCCCCHEVCPVNAIHMRQSPLMNFFT